MEDKKEPTLVDSNLYEVQNTNLECWDPKLAAKEERLTLIEDLNKVYIVPYTH